MANLKRRNGRMALGLVAFAGVMLGVSFAAVPLYQLFCQVTGYGGTPKTEVVSAPAEVSNAVITVRFDANTNRALPWNFKPVVNKVQVRLGEPNLAFYKARNDGAKAITGTATFNVAPFKAGEYFSKIDCFCFTEQTLKAGASADMPVQFFVDPAIRTDPNTRDLKEITLSYTFFRAEDDDAKKAPETAENADQDRRKKSTKG